MILKGLFPVEVDANGLMAAFDELAAQTKALTGITCRFDFAEPITLRDNMTARHLYHIAKEAVTNAVKHGSPTHIEITLNRDGDFVDLGVRDNGRGFSEPLDECQGMGLRIMRYRAALIGATLPSVALREGVPWSPADSARTVTMAREQADARTRPARVLIVDDHPIVREGLARSRSSSQPDLEVCGAARDVATAGQLVTS